MRWTPFVRAGEHRSIIDAEFWEQVSATIIINAVERGRCTNLRGQPAYRHCVRCAWRRLSPSHHAIKDSIDTATMSRQRARAGMMRPLPVACRLTSWSTLVQRLTSLPVDRRAISDRHQSRRASDAGGPDVLS